MKTRVRALIVQEGAILLIHRIKKGEEYYVFPGGGVEEGESVEDALVREGTEELGVLLDMGEQYACHSLDLPEADKQQELFFRCTILSGTLGTGTGPEFQSGTGYEGMYALEWVPISDLANRKILPEAIKQKIIQEGVS